MKRFLLTMAMAVVALAAVPRSHAEVSVDFFYNNLDGGAWYEVPDYGYVWQPSAASSSSWRPYADGYWAYTDLGWTWVSYEDFGWATYHYGRWVRLNSYGWCWQPGTEWGPAWVSWRTGGDYVGWAPLPPTGGEVIYEGRPITGYVDVEYDIGPMFYNFIDVRYIGEPVLRTHIYDYNQNIVFINKTVNVTNITYNDNRVYNYGPDYNMVSKYSLKPVQKLVIKQDANVDPAVALKSGAFTKVQGNQLVVAAPMKLAKAGGATPKQIKAKLEKSQVETGWSGVKDPAVKQQLVQKFKSENAKNVPPPQIAPKAGADTAAGTAVSASPAAADVNAGVNTGFSAKGKNKRGANAVMPEAAASASAAAGANAAVEPNQFGGGKGKGKNRHNDVPQAAPNGDLSGGQTNPPDMQGGGKHNRDRMRREIVAPTTATPAGDTPPVEPMGGGKRARRFEQQTPGDPSQGQAQDQFAPGGGRKHREQVAPPFGGNPPPEQPGGVPPQQGLGKHKGKFLPTPTPTPGT